MTVDPLTEMRRIVEVSQARDCSADTHAMLTRRAADWALISIADSLAKIAGTVSENGEAIDVYIHSSTSL